MEQIVIKANAKVNLSLDVLGVREDGYHEMKMINHSIDLEDTLIFEPEEEKVILTSNDDSLPLDERNLVIKAVRAVQKRFELRKGVKIHLEKKIPAEAGLAGGSSDAAAALKGLNRIWKLNLTQEELLEIGVGIGADVPYCLIGGTALVEGIGEKITPLKPLKKFYVLVVKPAINIATPWAFNKLDESAIETHPNIPAIIEQLEKESYENLDEMIGNVFEPVVFKCYPEIEVIKKKLAGCGAMAAIMTGSGSTVVGYFSQRKMAEKAQQVLGQKYKTCFVSETIE